MWRTALPDSSRLTCVRIASRMERNCGHKSRGFTGQGTETGSAPWQGFMVPSPRTRRCSRPERDGRCQGHGSREHLRAPVVAAGLAARSGDGQQARVRGRIRSFAAGRKEVQEGRMEETRDKGPLRALH
jgi:hypothetical protein